MATVNLDWKSGFGMETSNHNNEKRQVKNVCWWFTPLFHRAGACNYLCCHNNRCKSHFFVSAASLCSVTHLRCHVGLLLLQMKCAPRHVCQPNPLHPSDRGGGPDRLTENRLKGSDVWLRHIPSLLFFSSQNFFLFSCLVTQADRNLLCYRRRPSTLRH